MMDNALQDLNRDNVLILPRANALILLWEYIWLKY